MTVVQKRLSSNRGGTGGGGDISGAYTIVTLSAATSSAVDKSGSLLNMFAGEELFATSSPPSLSARNSAALFVTSDNTKPLTPTIPIASTYECKFMGREDAPTLRLVRTRNFSSAANSSSSSSRPSSSSQLFAAVTRLSSYNGGGETENSPQAEREREEAHIRKLADYVATLDTVDLFILCMDGRSKRDQLAEYTKRLVGEFARTWPQFLAHTIVVFNQWTTPAAASAAASGSGANEAREQLKSTFEQWLIQAGESDSSLPPCFFIDSVLCSPADTASQIIDIMDALVARKTACDVRVTSPQPTPSLQKPTPAPLQPQAEGAKATAITGEYND